jgi:glycosyltransferase involved in cell wall biosynthesis
MSSARRAPVRIGNRLLVSVLLPTRDAEETVLESLDCLCRQKGLEEGMEIIVVDDGSLDGTLDLLHAAARRNPCIRILALPRAGIVHSLNEGLSHAHGRFIARMDADDLCSEDRLSLQLRHMARHPHVDVVATAVRMFPEHEVTPGMRRFLAWQNRWFTHGALERNLFVECPLAHASSLFRREALETIGGWRGVDGPEDLDLFLRGAAAGWRFGKVNRVLYHWREHPGRTSRRDPRLRRYAFRRLALDAFARRAPRSLPVRLWGWGRSLEEWDEGLRARGYRVHSDPVNPRVIRRGEALPARPDPATVWGLRLSQQSSPPPGIQAVWLLAYGATRSHDTLDLRLRSEGYRPVHHYRLVS